MSATIWTCIGTGAALLTSFGFLPQVLKMWQRRSVGDVSVTTLGQFTMGVILWALYGLYLRDAVVVGANVVTLGTLLVGLALFFRFRHAPASGFVQGALRGAEDMGVDPIVAIRDSAKGLIHATVEGGGDVSEAAGSAVLEAYESAKSAALATSPETAADAAAIGALEGARELGRDVATRVRKAVSKALDGVGLEMASAIQAA